MLDLGKYIIFSLLSIFFSISSFSETRKFNIGKIATKQEVAGWDIDIRPDGLDISSSIEISPGLKDIKKTEDLFKFLKRN